MTLSQRILALWGGRKPEVCAETEEGDAGDAYDSITPFPCCAVSSTFLHSLLARPDVYTHNIRTIPENGPTAFSTAGSHMPTRNRKPSVTSAFLDNLHAHQSGEVVYILHVVAIDDAV